MVVDHFTPMPGLVLKGLMERPEGGGCHLTFSRVAQPDGIDRGVNRSGEPPVSGPEG